MDTKMIEALLKLFEASNATKISIREGDFSFKAEKAGRLIQDIPAAAPVVATEKATAVVEQAPEGLPQITAPLVGTVYLSPAPGEPPFVSVDQKIQKGDTVCIIEAMKVMNEIPAPFSGTVRDILCSDGSVVGFGDVLMVVER